VAEELGQARLVLTLDDGPLRKGLQDAKRLIEQELGGAVGTATRSATTTTRRASAAPKGPDAAQNTAAQNAATRAAAIEAKLTRARERTAQTTLRTIEQERKAAAERQKNVVSNAIIGGAFPLLFGQGAGASLGGLTGGALGGLLGGQFGFGLSLVGTALGTQIDELTQRFVSLGNALQDPIANFDQFVEKATLASKAQEALVKALQETGQLAAAAEVIRAEATRTIDPIAAQGAAAAQDNFNRSLSDLQDVLGNIVAGPATGFLNFLSSTLRLIAGAPSPGTTNPFEVAQKSERRAAESIGRNVGALIAGSLLATGGVASLFATGGASAPVAAGIIGTGLSVAGIGVAGTAAGSGDIRVAQSQKILELEVGLNDAKKIQAVLESQILKARTAGKDTLAEQLDIQAKFASLRAEELAGLSQIEQERIRQQDSFNDLEDQAAAIKQEADLRKAIDLRRQALLAAAAASQTAAVKSLADAKELIGVYGSQREVLLEQQKIRNAGKAAAEAQTALNVARVTGADPKEVEAAGKAVNAAITQRTQAELEGKEKIRRITSQITAQSQLDAANNQLALQAIRERISNAQTLAATEQGLARNTLKSIQAIQAGINESKRREQSLGAEIDAARIAGAPSEQVTRLVDNQRVAAEETKARLVEGAQALKEAGESLRDNFRDAVLNLTKVRSDPSGLNRFLSPGARARRAEQDTNRLLPFFRVAERQFFERTGEKAPPSAFRGSPEAVNQAIRDFIQAVNAEREAELAVQNAQAAINLVKTNQDLINANVTLAQVTQLLVDKDWTVNVFPPSAGRPADPVNAINGLS
jgi:hypothetical protein